MAYEDHQKSSSLIAARCGIVTLSDTRTLESDRSGQTIRDLLTAAGHTVPRYELIADEPATLEALLNRYLTDADLDAIITNGGTGISPRDQTIPIIEKLLSPPLPGFGELFRMLSYKQIGSGALLSRATAGIARGKLLFALPGSTKAVELAMTKLILPELRHLLAELRKSTSLFSG